MSPRERLREKAVKTSSHAAAPLDRQLEILSSRNAVAQEARAP